MQLTGFAALETKSGLQVKFSAEGGLQTDYSLLHMISGIWPSPECFPLDSSDESVQMLMRISILYVFSGVMKKAPGTFPPSCQMTAGSDCETTLHPQTTSNTHTTAEAHASLCKLSSD